MNRLPIVVLATVLSSCQCTGTETTSPPTPVGTSSIRPCNPPDCIVDAGGWMRPRASLDPDEVDIEFRGLVAFVRTFDGMKSVFLTDGTDQHSPYVTVDTGALKDAFHNLKKRDKMTSKEKKAEQLKQPDYVADASSGVWEFEEAVLEDGNIDDRSLTFDTDVLTMGDKDLRKLRWVPFLQDILNGAKEDADDDEVQGAPAVATWKRGKMFPIFDSSLSQEQEWDIGTRKSTAVADGVRIRIRLVDQDDPLTLRIKRRGVWISFPVRGGSTIRFSDFPTEVPRRNEDDLRHFHHFYKLRKKTKTGPHPSPVDDSLSTPNPARCAPIIFP